MEEEMEKKPARRWSVMVLGIVAVWIIVACIVVTLNYFSFRSSTISLPAEGMEYQLKPGTSMSGLAKELVDLGVINHQRFLVLLGREQGFARHLQAGEYQLTGTMTPLDMLRKFSEGDVKLHSLTIIEGQTIKDILAVLYASDEIQAAGLPIKPSGVMARLNKPNLHPEGRFLPDTYYFPSGTTDVKFLKRANKALNSALQAAWEGRAEDLPFKSPDEALILASIVEKETGVVEERPVIAGVFINRLRKGMRLQTDPTVIYGMGDLYNGNIRRVDLQRHTPYNTYINAGLPPTPIAMAGRHAIHSVMHPKKVDYLYFVAMGNGRHYFSKTLKEHNRAVDKFQRGKKHIKLSDQDQLR